MNYIYAIIDSNNICIDVIYVNSAISKSNYIRINAETAKTALYATYNGSTFTPAPTQEVVDVWQEVIAENAVLSGGRITLTLPNAVTVTTGTLVKFKAPCDCSAVTSGLVIDGQVYTVCDAALNCVTGGNGVSWKSGALVAVVVDTAAKKAFLQNRLAAAEGHTHTAAQVGAAPASHTHDDRYYTETETNNLLGGKAPAYTYGTADLTAGSSPLADGTLYFVYE